MKEDHFILSLDCGSTNLKAALFDGGLNRLADAKLPVHSLTPGVDRLELDSFELWHRTIELLQLTCQQVGLDYHQVDRLAITSQAQTFLLLDENGAPLIPLISWLDRRATQLLPQIQQALGTDFSRHCSFPSPQAQLQASKLLWLQKFAPDLMARAGLVALLPTWLALRLGSAAAIDDNIAAMSGLYSLQSRGYWQAALELCGIRETQLPSVVKTGTVLPSTNMDIILAGNDQTCGAIGNNCQKGVWIATLGTALVAYRLAGQSEGPYHAAGCWGPYPCGGYYELAVLDYGCSALDWAHQVLFPGRDLTAFFYAAHKAYRSSSATRMHFYPERIGSFSAWYGNGSENEMALSVLEGIGYALRGMVYDELGAAGELEKLVVTGGGSRNEFWLQILADILRVPIQRGCGDSLFGAARLANPGIAPPQSEPPQTWFPVPARSEAYEDVYTRWQEQRLKHLD